MMVSDRHGFLQKQISAFCCHEARQERLLGRAAEESILLNSYFASLSSSGGSPANVILIRGDSGMGKTRLAETLRAHVVEDDGFFIRGKFDQISSAKPYSGIATAFGQYCSLLQERGQEAWSEVSAALRREIREDEGKLLFEAIPALRMVILADRDGDGQSDDSRSVEEEKVIEPGDDLNSASRSHRLNYALKKFVYVISSIGSPIVLLIDDMQWVDFSSLELIKALILGARNPFTFLFTYRPVQPDHPFVQMMDDFDSTQLYKTEIMLQNLNKNSVHELVASILSIEQKNNCASLSNFICHATNGNPFFVRQQIISLCDDGLLCFDGTDWTWEIEKIKESNVLGDVVTMITEKIKKLPPLTQDALTICACIGSKIDLHILGLLVRNAHCIESPDQTENEDFAEKAISMAFEDGLIVETQDDTGVTFIHDSVQSAAYSLLAEENQAAYHLKLGRILLRDLCPNLFQFHLFTIANQLARGYELITDQEERIASARIFLQAGESSKMASAFTEAHYFFVRGIHMLRDEDWNRHYRLCCDTFTKAAEVAALKGDYDDMDSWLAVIFERTADSLDDLFRARYIHIKSLAARNEMEAAVDLGIEALKLVGLHFPSRYLTFHILADLAKTRYMMRGKSGDELLKLPPIIDKQMAAALRLLHLLVTLSVSGKQKLLPLLCFRVVQLNLKYGMSTAMPAAMALYGCLLSRFGFSPTEAAKYAEIALTLQEHLECIENAANVSMLNFGVILPFTKRLSDCLKPLYDGYNFGLESGDILHAMRCAEIHGWVAFHSGQPLTSLVKSLEKFSDSMQEYNSIPVLKVNQVYQQAVLNFLGYHGASNRPEYLKGEIFHSDITFSNPNCQKHVILNGQFKFMQMVTAYFFGEFELAWKMSEEVIDFLLAFRGFIFRYICAFYRGLTALTMLQMTKNRQFAATAKSCLKVLRKGRKKSPTNITHQLYFLEAEYAITRKKYDRAEKCFSLAIGHATSNGVTHEHALACERFGLYHLSRHNHNAAYEQVRVAYKLYSKWGSRPKCILLKKRFPHLLEERRDPKKILQQRGLSDLSITSSRESKIN